MFFAFIDDGGTAPDQKVASATALVVPAARVRKLESEWNSFKEKYGIESFHTSECVSKNSHSKFADWDDLKVSSAITRVRQISKKYGVRAFSFATSKDDYDAHIPSDLRPRCGEYHYTWAIKNLVVYIDEWAAAFGKNHEVNYFFDWMDPRSPNKKEVDLALLEAERVRPGRFVGHYSFGKRKDVAGLQCVDTIAWICYRFALHKIVGARLSALQKKGWDDLNNYREQDEWLLALGQKAEQIQNFLKLRQQIEVETDVKLAPYVRRRGQS